MARGRLGDGPGVGPGDIRDAVEARQAAAGEHRLVPHPQGAGVEALEAVHVVLRQWGVEVDAEGRPLTWAVGRRWCVTDRDPFVTVRGSQLTLCCGSVTPS